MESTVLPVVQVIPRTRYGVRGGDENLKRRIAVKFAENEVIGAVRELALAEGLASHDGDTLRALKESTIRPQKTLAFLTHLMGL